MSATYIDDRLRNAKNYVSENLSNLEVSITDFESTKLKNFKSMANERASNLLGKKFTVDEVKAIIADVRNFIAGMRRDVINSYNTAAYQITEVEDKIKPYLKPKAPAPVPEPESEYIGDYSDNQNRGGKRKMTRRNKRNKRKTSRK